MGFRADMRAAAVTLLKAYAASASVKLQVYPGRPKSVNPPTAFVESIRESIAYPGMTLVQRVPAVDVLILHGLWDTADTAEQGDDFIDGFLDWVTGDYHAAGADTLIAVTATEDDPDYVPDWLPGETRSYYATRLTLEGFAERN
jgi:hypothetical protein